MQQDKPTIVYVVAVFGIIFGVFGFCFCGPLGLLGVFITPEPQNFMGITIPAPTHTTGEKILLILGFACTIPASGLLLAGSIGSFYFKPWARMCMLAYTALYILGTILSTVGNLSAAQAQTAAIMGSGAGSPALNQASTILGAIMGVICFCIYPIIVAIVYNLPKVRQAFSGGADFPPPPPGGFGGGPVDWSGYPPQPGPYAPPAGYPPAYPPAYPPQASYPDPNQGAYYPPPPANAPPPPPSYYPPQTPYPPYPADENGPPPPPPGR